jgi:hypothetical protein
MINIKELLDQFIEKYPDIAFNENAEGALMTRLIILDEDNIDSVLKYIYKTMMAYKVDTITLWEEDNTNITENTNKQSLYMEAVRTGE